MRRGKRLLIGFGVARGRLVVGGKLSDELLKTGVQRVWRELIAAGRLERISEDLVAARTEDIKERPDYVSSSSCSEIVLSQLEHSVRHRRGSQGDECEAGKHLA